MSDPADAPISVYSADSIPPDLPDPYVCGSEFNNMNEARDALLLYTVARGKSYSIQASDSKRCIAVCRSSSCEFRVRISVSKESRKASTTVSVAHTCPPETHEGWNGEKSTRHLRLRNKSALENDPSMNPRKIQSMERARGNNISYLQSWRAVKAAEDRARKDSEWIDPFRHDPESRSDHQPQLPVPQSSEMDPLTTELANKSPIEPSTPEPSSVAELISECSVADGDEIDDEITLMIRAGVRYREIEKRMEEIEAPKLAAFEEAHFAYLMNELVEKGRMPPPHEDKYGKGLEGFYPIPAAARHSKLA